MYPEAFGRVPCTGGSAHPKASTCTGQHSTVKLGPVYASNCKEISDNDFISFLTALWVTIYHPQSSDFQCTQRQNMRSQRWLRVSVGSWSSRTPRYGSLWVFIYYLPTLFPGHSLLLWNQNFHFHHYHWTLSWACWIQFQPHEMFIWNPFYFLSPYAAWSPELIFFHVSQPYSACISFSLKYTTVFHALVVKPEGSTRLILNPSLDKILNHFHQPPTLIRSSLILSFHLLPRLPSFFEELPHKTTLSILVSSILA